MSIAHARPRWAVFVASAVIVGLAVSACGSSSATPAPTAAIGPTQGAQSSAATPEPTGAAEPTPGPTESSETGIAGAESKLAAIGSYRFKVAIAGKGALGSFGQDSGQIEMTGTVVLKPAKALHFEMSGLDVGGGSGPSKMGLTIIGEKGWVDLGSGLTMEVPADSAQGMGQSFDSFRPEKLFGSTFSSYASGFGAGNEEQKNGVAAIHFKADESTLKGFAGAYGDGTWSADVWIAKDGGYPVSTSVLGNIETGENAGDFRMTMDITNVDDPANKVTPPA